MRAHWPALSGYHDVLPEIEQPPPAKPDHYHSSQPQNHPQPHVPSFSTPEHKSSRHQMKFPSTNRILGCLCCPCAGVAIL
ncbi:hypothetical protein C8R44DRAFT_821826 [Mycena epipterygia]|nr:hypothetical protein C8R44DRAFT_821826 [Mycena epipterygia]